MIPIVFTFDKRILWGAAVAIKSLIDHANSETIYDIYVLHPDLSETVIQDFESMIVSTQHRIQFCRISPAQFSKFPKNKGSWTEIVYYRMLIPEVLKQYNKAIYSDVDVFFCEDMTEVYQTDIEDVHWAGVRAERNWDKATGHQYYAENKNAYIYWSGFMLMNLEKMRNENKLQDFYDTVHTYRDRLRLFDLEVLNLACEIKELPFRYVTLETVYELERLSDCKEYSFLQHVYHDEELTAAKTDPAIIHYAGPLGKPWRRKRPPFYYKEYMDNVPKGLQKLSFRDWRKRLFGKR